MKVLICSICAAASCGMAIASPIGEAIGKHLDGGDLPGAVSVVVDGQGRTTVDCRGYADLAAKVKFAGSAQGFGTVTVSGALTIDPGATLEVDASALEKDGRYPLFSYGSCEGDFASVNVTGLGTVEKTSSGYLLNRSSGTVLIFR